jgi:hypothetical protein
MEMTNMMKSVVAACVLAALAVGVASAKSYDFSLSAPATAGSHELKAGQVYSVQVKGSEAVITGDKDRQSFSVPVKAEQSATKYDSTIVETTSSGSTVVVRAIGLGGSTTRLVLAQ